MIRRYAFVTTAALLFGPAMANADVVQDWNRIMVNTVSGQNPFAQARFAAITQLAVFEAVNATTGRYHRTSAQSVRRRVHLLRRLPSRLRIPC